MFVDSTAGGLAPEQVLGLVEAKRKCPDGCKQELRVYLMVEPFAVLLKC